MSRRNASWDSPRSQAALVGGLTLALVAAAGVGAGRSLRRIGGPPQLLSLHGYGGDLLLLLLIPSFVALVLILHVLVRDRRRKSDEPEHVVERPPMPWWLPWAILLVVLAASGGLIAALVLAFGTQQSSRLPAIAPVVPARASSHPRAPVPSTHTEPSVGFHWWPIVLALALFVLAAAFLLLRRGGSTIEPAEDRPRQLARQAVAASLEAVRNEPDPRRAVIRAYATMEGTLGEHGLGRLRSETALEYLARTIASLQVSDRPVRGLTDLFERAKFTPRLIDQQMKSDAVSALETLADDLKARSE